MNFTGAGSAGASCAGRRAAVSVFSCESVLKSAAWLSSFLLAATVMWSIAAPSRLRSGVLYEARFTIFARHELKNALILLSPGWSEGQQMNTIEPVPAVQASRDGDLLFTLGHIAKGKHYRLFLQFQVNPTNVAWHRPANVALYDSGALVLRIHHTLTIYP